jgi:thioredoxin-related protein
MAKTMEDFHPSEKIVKIERKNVSDMHRTKYGVKSYPTLVFVSDSGKMLGKLTGVTSIGNIRHTYQSLKDTDKIIKKGV